MHDGNFEDIKSLLFATYQFCVTLGRLQTSLSLSFLICTLRIMVLNLGSCEVEREQSSSVNCVFTDLQQGEKSNGD